MEKAEEVVNAIAEILTLRSEESTELDDSILAGAELDVDRTARLERTGFVVRLTDGSAFEVRVTQLS